MRILLISDTHGYRKAIQEVLAEAGKVDMVFHMGDIEGDEDYLRENANCPVYIVAGNNDIYSSLPDDIETQVGRYKVLVTHGHMHHIHYDLDNLEILGRAMEKDIVMFGHIHRPVVENRNGIYLINPGSLTYPRQSDHKRTYIIMELNDGQIHFELKSLENLF